MGKANHFHDFTTTRDGTRRTHSLMRKDVWQLRIVRNVRASLDADSLDLAGTRPARRKDQTMSDFVPKPGTVKIGGLGRAAQKLQAAREKAAHVKNGSKPAPAMPAPAFKAKDAFAGTKKTTFQRKAV